MANKAGLVWIDAQGERVLHVVTYGGSIIGLRIQMEAHSNAVVIEDWEGPDNISSGTPVVAQYPTVRMTAVLNYVDGSGSIGKVFLPSPLSSIFLSDGLTVDPAQISGLSTAVIGNVLAGSGNPVVAFQGGQLIATRFNAISTVP